MILYIDEVRHVDECQERIRASSTRAKPQQHRHLQ